MGAMLEIAGAILLAVLILVYLGQFVVLAASLFGVLLAAVSGGLIYFLRATPSDVALGVLAASVLISSMVRESNDESKRGTVPYDGREAAPLRADRTN
jgi:hypothetical protein